ncbi:Gaa1-like [Fragilaria crotonensis]|nr:Gaa1-like [Fragilaria crotonensis]
MTVAQGKAMQQANRANSGSLNPLVDTLKHRLWLLISLPYIIGAVWTLAYPVVSIVTGELKCRGWFIDENSLDAGNFRYNSKFRPPRKGGGVVTSLCKAIDQVSSSDDNVVCYTHNGSFDVAKLVPISNPVAPVSESIVIVIPSSEEWLASPFHYGMLQFMQHLATSSSSPWLAKTVLLVSPSVTSNLTIAGTVSTFLDAFLGVNEGSTSMLPPSYTTTMIRNLLVLDVAADTNGAPLNEVLLMPQGKRGVLPNMDLVFLFMSVYSRASFMDKRRYETNFLVHPYATESTGWHKWVNSNVPASLRNWVSELGDLALFTRTLAVGPYAAHTPALERGIDSLTLQIRFTGRSSRVETEFILEVFQWLEGIVRALSNLHERLHHSMTQYLMPSPFKFVSHSEYLVSHILLILPLVVRAVSLIFWEIEEFDLQCLKFVAIIWTVALGVHEVSGFLKSAQVNLLLVLIYGSIPLASQSLSAKLPSTHQSLHFLTCVAAVYAFVPLIMGNVALAFPSALLFTPMIAMLSHKPEGVRHSMVMPLVLFLSWPPVLILGIFGYYSSYITLVYIPLHLLLCVLWQLKVRL